MNDLSSAMSSLLARQHERLLKLSFPHNDGPQAPLLVNQMSAVESVSRDFTVTLELLCDDACLELKDLMGRMVTVELERADGSPRYFNGYVFEFRLLHTDGGYSFYQMVLRPWTQFLDLGQDNYLFHDKTLREALEEIFADYRPLADVSFRLQHAPEPETMRTQWDESDYNYLHRRLEEKGWYYWFEHKKDGHTLVISDDSTLATPVDGDAQVRFLNEHGVAQADSISQFSPMRAVMPGKVATSAFDFKKPRPLHASIDTLNKQGDVRPHEIYEYAGAYGFKDSDAGNRLARLRMEEVEAAAKRFDGQGNCRQLQAGRTFELTEHFDLAKGNANERQFLVLEVRHSANNNYLDQGSEAVYRNTFKAIRKHIPYHPARGFNSEQPKIYGMQTAIVVGPPGEVIHCDEYGRVRVQFHWDRMGKHDGTSSCWVRVATTWAGSNFGAIAIPRIGQEVVIQWLDGNPDTPLVVSSVYNGDNMPPWTLPDNKTQSGVLTRSPKGSAANANALRFEDKKGQEEVWLHAEKDQRIEVEHDESHTVGHDRSKTIGNDETVHVKHDRTETVDNNETITVHNNRQERVDHNETISIGDNRSEDVGKNETIHIGHNRSVTVGGMKTETVTLAKAETIGLAKALTIGGAYQVSVGAAMNTTVALVQAEEIGLSKLIKVMQNFSTSVGKTFSIAAGGDGGSTLTMDAESITLQVGKSTIAMKKSGEIEISGTKVTLAGSDSVNFVSPNINNN